MSKSPWTPLQIIVLLCFIHQRDSGIVMILYGVHVLPTWWDIYVIVSLYILSIYILIYIYYICIYMYMYMILYVVIHIYIYSVRKYTYIYIHIVSLLWVAQSSEKKWEDRLAGGCCGMNQETCHDWESWRGFQTWATLDLGCWSLGHSNSKASLPGGNHLRKQLGLTWVDITFCVDFSVVLT